MRLLVVIQARFQQSSSVLPRALPVVGRLVEEEALPQQLLAMRLLSSLLNKCGKSELPTFAGSIGELLEAQMETEEAAAVELSGPLTRCLLMRNWGAGRLRRSDWSGPEPGLRSAAVRSLGCGGGAEGSAGGGAGLGAASDTELPLPATARLPHCSRLPPSLQPGEGYGSFGTSHTTVALGCDSDALKF